jgi:hypothetical protein
MKYALRILFAPAIFYVCAVGWMLSWTIILIMTIINVGCYLSGKETEWDLVLFFLFMPFRATKQWIVDPEKMFD